MGRACTGAVTAGGQRPSDCDDVGYGTIPRDNGERPVFVSHRRTGSTSSRRQHVPLDAERYRCRREGIPERLAVLSQGVICACCQNILASVVDSELGFILRSRVHELHVADTDAVAHDKLDAVVGGVALIGGAY